MSEKDFQDIDFLIKKADKNLIKEIIKEVINRNDLFESKKEEFKRKLKVFRERYDV
ncbi:hypothetical protein L21TH_2642 [Caldisalinibacter kiritimatiensis]|uniref:Uncharacterized protein n=1 Tax=Caldisalinibacter kiritimatiensis TaxID=1304284 RepID=R1CAP1_9FIRM|nr:hypothetical protein L21TH_2642 [Caldisalinibacter kiritimatiensis]